MKARDSEAVKQVADESGAADHRAGGNGRAGVGKSKLEKPERQESHSAGFIGCRHALQEKPVVADQAVAVAEHERETEGEEEDAAETGIHDAFHQHVDGLARATEAGLEHGEADLHAKNQERSHQRPDRVERIDDVIAL